MTQQIVVGDDGRSGGDAALSAARFLSTTLGAKVHVVHSIDIPGADDVGGHPLDAANLRAELAERAEAWLEARVKSELPGAGATQQVAFVGPHHAILRAVRSVSADLVVIGGHVKDHLFDLGGVQRALFAQCHTSLWSQPRLLQPIQRILVPVDPLEPSDEPVVFARDLAVQLDVPVVAIHCSPPPIFAEPTPMYGAESGMPDYVVEAMHAAAKGRFETWFDGFDWRDARAEARFEIGTPITMLTDAQSDSDLVVMATAGHTGISAALVGGVTYGLLKHAKGPVMALRTRTEAAS